MCLCKAVTSFSSVFMQNSDDLQQCLCKAVMSFRSVFMQNSDELQQCVYAKQ
jgi:hypothetical protein